MIVTGVLSKEVDGDTVYENVEVFQTEDHNGDTLLVLVFETADDVIVYLDDRGHVIVEGPEETLEVS